jgi:EF-P lysine aminoacylase GenX
MTKWQDLRSNPYLWKIFKTRAHLIKKIRVFFDTQGFLEVQTPLLAPYLIPESYLEIFETEMENKLGKKTKAYLTTSPEMWHKKLLAASSGNIYEITKSFRNTDIEGHFHNPEFTLLEWYRISSDYKETMKDCQQLIRFLNNNKPLLTYQGKQLDISKPFLRISAAEAFEKYAGVKQKDLFSLDKIRSAAEENKLAIKRNDSWEDIYNLLFLQAVEPNLGMEQPTIIYDFPGQFAPLAKPNPQNPKFKKRFEVYLFGVELADAYDELTDPKLQKKEFIKEENLRKKLNKTPHPADKDFLEALKKGLPDCSGVALGIDRLTMIFTDQTDINNVILFAGEEIFDF